MSLYMRVSILLVVILVSPSLQWRRFSRQANLKGETCKTPRNVAGQCIDIKSCPELLSMLHEQKEPGWKDYLLKSQCGTKKGNVVKVCCPPDPLPDTSVCGRSEVFATRVVNGQPAVLGAWPWMVALGYSSPNKKNEWLCGGSLISNRHVLTAAHCVSGIGNRKLNIVRVGDLNLDEDVQDNATPIDVVVEKTFVHENYDAAAHTVDIALVKLKNPVEFTTLIRPICIPSKNTFDSDLTRFEPFVTGWGAIGYKEPATPALQEAQIDIADMDSCREAYKNIKGATIDERVICAISAVGRDTCQGDSGGPLILPQRANFYLVGVVSYGYKCAEPGFPGIYTKVSLYIDWIRKMMRS